MVPQSAPDMAYSCVKWSPGRLHPGRHALARAEKGLVGVFTANGKAYLAIFHSDETVDHKVGHYALPAV